MGTLYMYIHALSQCVIDWALADVKGGDAAYT